MNLLTHIIIDDKLTNIRCSGAQKRFQKLYDQYNLNSVSKLKIDPMLAVFQSKFSASAIETSAKSISGFFDFLIYCANQTIPK